MSLDYEGPFAVCQTCSLPIPLTALKCTQCDSWQDWRGSLNISTTVLSLIIALVSVAGTTAVVWKDIFTPKRSVIDGRFQYAWVDQVGVLITNRGAKPGTVLFYNLRVLDRNGAVVDEASLSAHGEKRPAVLLRPGEAALVDFSGTHFKYKHEFSKKPWLQCQGILTGTSFDGKKYYKEQIIRCGDLGIFQHKLHKADKPGPRLYLLPAR